MAYVRGHPADYARWAAGGLPSWDFAQVLPYFRRMERWEDGADAWRGGDGPLTVQRCRYQDPLNDAFRDAAIALSYPWREDYNGAAQSGFGVLQGTIAATTVSTTGNACAKDDANNLDVGNVVYVFSGTGVAADDVDGTGDPIATVAATRNTAGDYVYRTLIAPGSYTVAFTCQAGNDAPDTDETGTANEIAFLPTVNIANTGGISTVDF